MGDAEPAAADLEVRPPKQRRSREAWNRVLDAGVAILEEGGYDAFTIAAVCERAAVAPTGHLRAHHEQGRPLPRRLRARHRPAAGRPGGLRRRPRGGSVLAPAELAAPPWREMVGISLRHQRFLAPSS